ncbi:substrate-binding periplasmic protein [Roseateles sp.]|jgi:polar amino acid transport system substrate-binding protein|uniref:substrate-binding periplasmic protein n=1 Tax=Roseateles sp. TaxID=1971397 RepID=UPI0037CB48EB
MSSNAPPSAVKLGRRLAMARLALAAGSGLANCGPVRAGQSLELLTHYDYPPFITTRGNGLSHDLASTLTELMGGLISRTELQLLPRRRLDMALSAPTWQGLVPWVKPAWFGDESESRFLWSPPLLADTDLVLSLKSRAVEFNGPASLRGLTLGGVAGHRYADVEAMIEAGELTREDTINTEQNLRKLLRGRVDVVFLAASGLPWWQQQLPEMAANLYIARQPRNSYLRRALISRALPKPTQVRLMSVLTALRDERSWLARLEPYGLKPAGR